MLFYWGRWRIAHNANVPAKARHIAAAVTAFQLELDATPDHFTLYGGTALALRLGYRQSVDFDLSEADEQQRFAPELVLSPRVKAPVMRRGANVPTVP